MNLVSQMPTGRYLRPLHALGIPDLASPLLLRTPRLPLLHYQVGAPVRAPSAWWPLRPTIPIPRQIRRSLQVTL